MTALQVSGSTRSRTAQAYRIDFALIVITGNITRYKIVRPLVEQDQSVAARWYPIRTWFEADPLRILPGAMRIRLRHLMDTWPAFVNSPPDAMVLHAFETYYMYVIWQRMLGRKTVIVNHPDGHANRSRLYSFAYKHTDLFLPWSNWAAQKLKADYPEIPDEKIAVLHPGINLAKWPMRTPHTRGPRFKLLFVGGAFLRKGGDTLLDAFEAHLQDSCELVIATQSAFLPPPIRERIARLPNCTLHLDLVSNSDTLKQLYRETDCFVMPTRLDTSSWVALEAMSIGIPVVISNSGGISDIVIDGKTGLMTPPDDPVALARAIHKLQSDPELYSRIIQQGRAHVEEHFNAERNTERFLDMVKDLIDRRRGQSR